MQKYSVVLVAAISLVAPTKVFGQEMEALAAYDYQFGWYQYLEAQYGNGLDGIAGANEYYDEQAYRWSEHKKANPGLPAWFVDEGDAYMASHYSYLSTANSAMAAANNTLGWIHYQLSVNDFSSTTRYYYIANDWPNLLNSCNGPINNANGYVVNALAAAGAANGDNWSNTEDFASFMDYYSVPYY